MPFARPTLRELQDRFRQDIRTYTDGGDALLRRSVESVLAKIVPGLTHGLYGYLAWAARQIFPDVAEAASVTRWAAIYGITPRAAAAAICTSATFSTTGTAAIPVGHLVQRGDGVRYLVTSSSVAGGVCTVALVAEVPGEAGNADPSTPLSLVSPVAGVAPDGVVTDPFGIHDGVDPETIEQLRARVVQRIKNPPRGGGVGDYERWALEVPGVTRVWVTPRVEGAGTVGVMFATDAGATPIPSGTAVTDVQAHLAARAPVTIGRSIDGEWKGVITKAPTALPLVIEISGLTPNTTEVQDAIKAEVVDFLRREAEPGATIPLSRFDEAISSAAGEVSHVLVSPSADIVPATDELPIYDDFTSPIVWS